MIKETNKSLVYLKTLSNENKINEPRAYREYAKKKERIENTLTKKSLCKTLCLIIDEVNYNDYIAQEYYKQHPEKKFSNPKVTTQFLRELRDANIIIRSEMDGRKQIYKVNWKGLFDIIRFRNIEDWDSHNFFNLSQWFYYPHSITFHPKLKIEWACRFSEKEMEKITESFIEKFFKPYVKKFVSYRLSYNFEDGMSYKTKDFDDPYSEKIKEVANINFDILYLLDQFDYQITVLFPRVFQKELYSIINNPKLENASKLIKFLFACYKDYYNLEDYKLEYSFPENPESEILDSFNSQIKKIGFEPMR